MADASPLRLVMRLCAPRSHRDGPTEGWLKVQVVEQGGTNILVRLPQSTVENGQHVAVRPEQLRSTLEPVGVLGSRAA